ncbi:MAG: UbiD family decarboxylase [Candidatus Bathyarchaeia archaeon]
MANAEIVIEAEIQPGVMLMEDLITEKRWAILEMAGYMRRSAPAQVLKVKAITHRENAIYQTLINPEEEHNIIVGIPAEAEIINVIWREDALRQNRRACPNSEA